MRRTGHGTAPVVDVRPLRGVRFDSHVAGTIGPLLAPPYDVAADGDGASPFSIRHIEDVDLGNGRNDHALAAERYRAWLVQGVLRREESPALYVHRHWFQVDGKPILRTGLLARVRLTDWDDRVVLPHERTTRGPREERLARLRAVNANLSPLYFLYRDPSVEISDLVLVHAPAGDGPREADRMGGYHQLTVVADPDFHVAVQAAFARRTVFVADGHHRYEAALAYRNECRSRHGYDSEAPWEFVLTLLAAVEDPGVRVLPTHRVVFGPDYLAAEIETLLRRWFDIVPAGESDAKHWDNALFHVVLAGAGDDLVVKARPGNPHFALLPADRSPVWRSLDVSAVASVMESVMGAQRNDTVRIKPVVDGGEAARPVRTGQAAAAFLLPPPSLDRLLAVAEAGDLLPAKSTWFEPKAPAGLVINDLRS